ncbi:hypothetical protein [Shimia sp. R10_1]|uniref:hypothetical protein n=1 Tax=Shimia sp. R10_1 TaxID=2821095 RepID=UPI001FFE2C0B|nr:hypothetical protein [Shimia sp. R10_1]
MPLSGLAGGLLFAVCAMGALVAWYSRNRSPLEQDRDDPDYHHLRSDYQSGVGGGNVRTWKVPKDPQEYARLFVPEDTTDSDASK